MCVHLVLYISGNLTYRTLCNSPFSQVYRCYASVALLRRANLDMKRIGLSVCLSAGYIFWFFFYLASHCFLHKVWQTDGTREPRFKTLRSPLKHLCCRILEALRVELLSPSPRFASLPERGNDNISLNFRNWIHDRRYYNNKAVPQRFATDQVYLCTYSNFTNTAFEIGSKFMKWLFKVGRFHITFPYMIFSLNLDTFYVNQNRLLF